jgi:sialate O-acetylesterase
MRFGLLAFFCILVLCFNGEAQIRLPKLISDNAVLQRDRPLKLFGWSSPGENIELRFNQKNYSTVASDAGEWQISLPPQRAGGPYDLVFIGKSEVKVSNILFGDVWLCSGQSNMEMVMNNVKDKFPEVVSSSKNPFIRHFTVPQRYDFKKPNDDLAGGNWREADPETVLQFSAVAYFFAREIYEKHGIPIGLVNASLGGSPAEAWMSEDALLEFPSHLQEAIKFRNDSLIQAIETSDRNRIGKWYDDLAQKDVGISSKWRGESLDDRAWPAMTIPGYWDDNNFVKGNGAMWFRRSFDVNRSMIDKPVRLFLGRIVDQDSIFINNEFVGTTGYQYPQRRYRVREGLLREGKNTIAIKIINQSGKGGFVPDKPYCITVEKDTIDLRGKWKYKPGASMPPLGSQAFIRWKPLGLYNAMIAPLTRYPIAGVIWYQGESNVGRANEYKELFPALIRNWRAKWNNNFPFLFVQLPNFMEPKPAPQQSDWAELRQAQYEATKLPKTGIAVAIDAGEWNDIHPLNKEVIGHRLALLAEKMFYGDKNLIVSGPEPEEWSFTRADARIKFKNATEGLIVKGTRTVQHVAISADGKTFVWAKTEIIKNTLRVWHESVTEPVIVRYAWADNPATANLFNKEGLPAVPFEIKK